MEPSRLADVIEIEQVLARYAVGMTKNDIEAVIDVFTPDGTYSAFGDTYTLADFPRLVAARRRACSSPANPPSSSTATRARASSRCASSTRRTTHMRIGWYTDTYRRTEHGWRLHPGDDLPAPQRRARLGQAHDPARPEPTTTAG